MFILILFFVPYHAFANTNAAAHFIDISDDYWAKKEIDFLSSKGIIQGRDSGEYVEFLPEQSVTRAQAAKMIVLALGEAESVNRHSSFRDISEDYWAIGWINKAVELGIFKGYDDGTFRPENSLTRAQMSKIIVEAFAIKSKYPDAENATVFSDVPQGNWALAYINRLYHHGIVSENAKQFRPNASISRAQFSVMLVRTLDESFRLSSPSVSNNTRIETVGIVVSSSLNVREQPSATAPLLGKLEKGQKVDVYKVDGFWVEIRYNGRSAYVHKRYLKLKSLTGSPIKGRIIVVDAGHGGKDSGAIGAGTTEKAIVLEVAKLLRDKLVKAGATVIMTRESDVYPTLEDRVNIAKNSYAEAFVSVHVNSSTNSSAKGTEVFYDTSKNESGEESKKLAQFIQNEIVKQASMADRKIKDKDFYVLRNNNITSVLVELGFISNSDDGKKLTSSNYWAVYANAIYEGILKYYQSE